MSASNWIELLAVLVPLLGGGGIGVSKLTRIAVGVEVLAQKIENTAATAATIAQQVQQHENRLTKGGL